MNLQRSISPPHNAVKHDTFVTHQILFARLPLAREQRNPKPHAPLLPPATPTIQTHFREIGFVSSNPRSPLPKPEAPNSAAAAAARNPNNP
ncbi:MAG: hypothetical protein ABSG03_34620, partial [Bryobacteraceae bacterium]